MFKKRFYILIVTIALFVTACAAGNHPSGSVSSIPVSENVTSSEGKITQQAPTPVGNCEFVVPNSTENKVSVPQTGEKYNLNYTLKANGTNWQVNASCDNVGNVNLDIPRPVYTTTPTEIKTDKLEVIFYPRPGVTTSSIESDGPNNLIVKVDDEEYEIALVVGDRVIGYNFYDTGLVCVYANGLYAINSGNLPISISAMDDLYMECAGPDFGITIKYVNFM